MVMAYCDFEASYLRDADDCPVRTLKLHAYLAYRYPAENVLG